MQELIHKFYTSFADSNSEGMVECYHEDIVFEDPAFGVLRGADAKNMWRMLIKRGKGDLKINFDGIKADGDTGSAKWIATYNYGPDKRKVVNMVTAYFEFKDGKIIKHTDEFDMWKWTQQALGISGYLLGWSSFMKKKIQSKTNHLLREYSKKP